MGQLVGTRALVRLIVRRDRVLSPIWIAILVVVTIATALAFARLFPTAQSRELLASGFANNQAIAALIGPAFDPRSIGGLTAWRIGGLGAVLAGLMSLLTVIRHTRAEEEAGRRELLGSAAVGRHAALAAALAVAVAANLVLATVITGGLAGVGLPVAGAAALGLSFAMVGVVFAAVAAVAAQLTTTARAARGIAGALLGLAYLSRAAGDASGVAELSWLSPIGWAQRARPFAGERWWVLVVGAMSAVALAAGAFALSWRRDLGAGVLRPRLGPAAAPPRLRSPLALAWRLHRGGLLGWSAAFAAIGAALGSVARSIIGLVEANPRLRTMVALIGRHRSPVDAYLAATMGIVGVLASAYAIQAVLRLRVEEDTRRAEAVLSTSVGRTRWAASHVAFAGIGPAIVLAAAGLAAGLAHGLRSGQVSRELPRLVGAALVQLPAVWVLAGIAFGLFGLAPRLAARASWAALVAFLLVDELGPLLQLSPRLLALSPFANLPRLPGGDLSPLPLLALAVIAAALASAGLIGLRRRDLGSG